MTASTAERSGRAPVHRNRYGWLDYQSDDTFEAAIRAQVQISIEEAVLICSWSTDRRDLRFDEDIARLIRGQQTGHAGVQQSGYGGTRPTDE